MVEKNVTDISLNDRWYSSTLIRWLLIITVVLEKTLESPLDCKEIQPVHPKGDESWVFIGRTDVEAENPVLWPPDAKSWLIGKDPDAWKDWGPEEKGMTEDEMVGWHHWLNGHGFGWTPGVGDGQGGLACCSPWGHKKSDTTEPLNWTDDGGGEGGAATDSEVSSLTDFSCIGFDSISSWRPGFCARPPPHYVPCLLSYRNQFLIPLHWKL